MQKTYKLNNVEISAEEVKKLVKENPEILEESESTVAQRLKEEASDEDIAFFRWFLRRLM